MKTADAIKQAYGFSQMVMSAYIGDLTDADLMERPGEGCNTIAWQLGHLISSECNLLNMAVPDAAVSLPDGFDEKHSKENAGSDDASHFCSKADYMELFEKVKTATFAAIDGLTDEDFDKPGPEAMRDFCPTIGSLLILVATHVMMHVGQVVPVRRRLDKPIVM